MHLAVAHSKIVYNGEKLYFQVGDTVGVMVTKRGDLQFFVNGQGQGLAAKGIPAACYGILSLRDKVRAVSINDS